MVTPLLLALCYFVAPGSGYHGGAPEFTCPDLRPNHGASPQTSSSPFTITFTPTSFTPGSSSPITVTLSTSSGDTFQGFLLTTQYEGTNVDTTARPGIFSTTPPVTHRICNNSAVTQSDRNAQNSLSFLWLPPATSSGANIRFRATFVRRKLVFWVDVKAASLLVDSSLSSGSGSQPVSPVSLTQAPETNPPSPSGPTALETQPPSPSSSPTSETQRPPSSASTASETQPPSPSSSPTSETQRPPSSASTASETQPPSLSGSTASESQPPTPSGSNVSETQTPSPSGSTALESQPPTPSGSNVSETQPPSPSGSTASETQPASPSGSIVSDTQPPSPSQSPSAAAELPLSEKPTTTAPPVAGKLGVDAECGRNKGCYADCQNGACNFLITWSEGSSAETVQMTMSGTVEGVSGRYIALGLSEDAKMGSDSVVYCVNQPNGVFLSYNVDNNKDNILLNRSQEGLSDMRVTYADGVLKCSFTRVKAADSSGQRFDLNKAFTLLYATGPGSEKGLGYHSTVKPRVSTQTASLVDFTVNIGGSASENRLIKAHGSLMIVAWIFAASIGIVLARYFKDVWQDSTWCGQKIWFQIHRSCMVLALLATVAAFIIIFVEVDGYSYIEGKGYQKAHPILGIIITALTVLNPIMALFRPHPGTSRRPIFNWAHWLVGSGAHILAVITIFFGILLNSSGAPRYMIYILAAYVGWQVLIQILLEIVQCLRHRNGHSDSYEMTSISQAESSKATLQKGVEFNKLVLLFLHILVIIGFSIALIVVFNIGKDSN